METKGQRGGPKGNWAPKEEEGRAEEADESKTDVAREDPSVEAIKTFDEMGLKDGLLRGIYAYGWEAPSYIQELAIGPCVAGRDVIGQAQSGKGKTGAFVVAALQRLDEGSLATQALILAPTRELAQQTHDLVAVPLAQYMEVSSMALIGGTARSDNYKALRSGVQIAVGTPGRVMDMIQRGALRTDKVNTVVIDEADEMLSRGFQEQVDEILRSMPPDVQVCLFSATMPHDVLQLSENFMRDPVRILVEAEELTLEGLKQFYVDVQKPDWKFDTLMDMYEAFSISQCIIFVNRGDDVERLVQKLNSNDFTCSAIHGRLEQAERKRVSEEFRSGQTRVLVTTDLLARGYDATVSMVINYDLPNGYNAKETYLHRIGRSARFGRKGIAISFVTQQDYAKIKELERHYATQIKELPMEISELT